MIARFLFCILFFIFQCLFFDFIHFIILKFKSR